MIPDKAIQSIASIRRHCAKRTRNLSMPPQLTHKPVTNSEIKPSLPKSCKRAREGEYSFAPPAKKSRVAQSDQGQMSDSDSDDSKPIRNRKSTAKRARKDAAAHRMENREKAKARKLAEEEGEEEDEPKRPARQIVSRNVNLDHLLRHSVTADQLGFLKSVGRHRRIAMPKKLVPQTVDVDQEDKRNISAENHRKARELKRWREDHETGQQIRERKERDVEGQFWLNEGRGGRGRGMGEKGRKLVLATTVVDLQSQQE